MTYPTVAQFRPTPVDPPLSTHLPDKADWVVTQMSLKNLKDRKGTEVHRFKHWGPGDFYVRIQPPNLLEKT